MVSFSSLITGAVTFTSIGIGILLSPLPTKIGFYRSIASIDPALDGLTPAFHHGIEWQYTFDELYSTHCPMLLDSGHGHGHGHGQKAAQTALITGANSGVGYETARVLAKCGVHVTMACRNPKKCAAAAQKIRDEVRDSSDSAGNGNDSAGNGNAGNGNAVVVIDTMTVDTSSLQSVKKFSMEFLAKYNSDSDSDNENEDHNGNHNGKTNGKALDMLYLNAGIGSTGGKLGSTNNDNGNDDDDELILSEDGIELIFATNYVGHHLMYKLLEPLLLKSKLARIVLTSSAASYNTINNTVATSIDTLNSAKNSDAMQLYGQSKLAQILWAKHLTTLHTMNGNDNIYVNACHPGAVDTYIWDKGDMEYLPSFVTNFVSYLRRNAMWTTEEGALTQIFLGVATDQLVSENIRGRYYHPQAREVINPLSLNEQLQNDLWEFSDALVAKFL